MVQTQRPGKPIIRHQVLHSSMSIACDVITCVRYCWTQVPSSLRAFFPFHGRHALLRRFLVLVEMDLLSFIRTTDLTKVRIGEKEHDEDEPKLLETTVRRVVPLLLVAPDCSSGELEASKTKVVDAGEPSHPAKKLRGDYEVSVEPTVGEREGGEYTELLAGANLHTLEAPQRFIISSDSSDHLGVNIAKDKVDSFFMTYVPIMTSATTATPTVDLAATANERLVSSLVFGSDSSSASRSHPISGGFSDRTGSDFLVSGMRTVVDPNSIIQRVYVPQWNMTNGSMGHDQLFTEFNVGATRPISFSAEVRMRAEYHIKEKGRLKSVVEEKDVLLKSRCNEIESLKVKLIVKEAEEAEVVRLRDEAKALKDSNTNLEKEKGELEVKVTDLAASIKDKEQEVADLDAVVTSVKLQNDSLADQVHKLEASAAGLQEKVTWLLTYGMELAIAKCLNFTEYLSTPGAAIGKAIEKGMQEGLSAANKDASVEMIMNLLLLEDALAEKLGLVESQPHVDQLMVPIHHSPDQCVVGSSALSLSLDVSSSRIRMIRENIANHVSALRGVFVPLSEPLSAMSFECMEGSFDAAPDTTTALSVTSVFASTILPISTHNYEIVHTEASGPAFNDALCAFNTKMKTDILSNDHTSDWLRVVPISGLGQTMNSKTYRGVLCNRLGVPLFSVSKSCSTCSKVFARDIYEDHAVSCAGIFGIKHRHNVVRDTLVDIYFRLGISAGKEVDIGLGGGWYLPLTQTGMVDFVPGRAVIDAAHRIWFSPLFFFFAWGIREGCGDSIEADPKVLHDSGH
nr:hypothetical protein [Tanacetum cinerariifolium]